MDAHRAGFEFRWVKELSSLWRGHIRQRHVFLSRWLPRVGVIVAVVVLVGSTVVWAAGDGRAPDQLVAQSPLPSPTNTPVPVPSTGFYYTVQRGDTLTRIAWRYGTTVQAIVQANGIVNPNLIYYGQRLWIPSSSGGWYGSTVYIVQRGDTLYAIARRYGTTYQRIAAANGLYYPYTIYVGQRLVIPGSGTSPPPSQRIYIVQRGDTLWAIAIRYGTTPWAIAAANGLTNLNYIYVGQRLIIP
jgi:LysM repeat protein